MRVEQPDGSRGSLKWMQHLVQHRSAALDGLLQSAGALAPGRGLRWLSPTLDDRWAEYRDAQWLAKIGLPHLGDSLKSFWPRGGPQWDGLATDGAGGVYLLEAKAHAGEMASSCQAGVASRRLIESSLDAAKRSLGALPGADWLNGYYQYANRLAHLGFLREHGVQATMVFLYFVGDADMRGPASAPEWAPHIERVHQHLGLQGPLPGVVSLCVPVP